ncbi:hypothetical protein PPERSA_02700 [Pseudocohnilembus persalinus]|uniref:Transmembrane protein n=1 Tax=Pseudocohnilembus persalinus TaxID=266149 RepID=A0A0V0R5P7_PSEPJ|nr:hypothetical protein PPERSA_02700 [Pseudocohnilembus persalinus]|eukprot:KRX09828.1 hypothetical protein PPERSA_02700 [Pseudocohnilembus persalinus]
MFFDRQSKIQLKNQNQLLFYLNIFLFKFQLLVNFNFQFANIIFIQNYYIINKHKFLPYAQKFLDTKINYPIFLKTIHILIILDSNIIFIIFLIYFQIINKLTHKLNKYKSAIQYFNLNNIYQFQINNF